MTDELQQRSFCVIGVYRTFQLRARRPDSSLSLSLSFQLLSRGRSSLFSYFASSLRVSSAFTATGNWMREHVEMRRLPSDRDGGQEWPMTRPKRREEKRRDERLEGKCRHGEFIMSSGELPPRCGICYKYHGQMKKEWGAG